MVAVMLNDPCLLSLIPEAPRHGIVCVSSFQVLDVTTNSGQLSISGAVFVPELSCMSDGVTTGWSLLKLRLGGPWGMDGVVLVAVGRYLMEADGAVGEFLSFSKILFLYLGWAWSSLLSGLFSSSGE